MSRYTYSSNAWGYYHVGKSLSVKTIVERICSLGFDGFDLLVGDDAYPACSIDEKAEFWKDIRHAVCQHQNGCVSIHHHSRLTHCRLAEPAFNVIVRACPISLNGEAFYQFKN